MSMLRNQISERVKEFYDRTPFPDYDLERFKTKGDLRNSATSDFVRYIDSKIPDNASVCEVGCGTGQLIAYLSLKDGRKCFGVDFAKSPLKKLNDLKEKIGLNLSTFQMDVLEGLGFSNQFDWVICTGVLHHTSDPYLGFQNLVKITKGGGFILIGLYNSHARQKIYKQKAVLKVMPFIKNHFLKKQIHDLGDKERARGWFNDQYLHPHESTHTVEEVLVWFKENGVEPIACLPALGEQTSDYFKKQSLEIGKDYSEEQKKWMDLIGDDGGLFMMLGRKK